MKSLPASWSGNDSCGLVSLARRGRARTRRRRLRRRIRRAILRARHDIRRLRRAMAVTRART